MPPVVVGFVSMLAVGFFRGQAMLSSSLFNPDEATLLAWGKRATLNLVPYKTYTVSDVLYLWPVFLGVLGDLDVHLTMVTAHVLSGIFYAYMGAAGWYVFYRSHGWKWATAIIVPAAIYLYAGMPSIDFLSLGSELLPVAMLVTAGLVYLLSRRDISLTRLAIGSVIAGSAIWAKPQVGPLALGLVVSAVILRKLEADSNLGSERPLKKWFDARLGRDSLVGLGAFVLPTVASLLLIALTGGWHAFLNDSIGFISNETGGASVSTASAVGPRAEAVGSFIASFPLTALWAIGGLIGWVPMGWMRRQGVRIGLQIAWVLPLATSVLTLFALNHIYDHYANILYAGALLSGMVGCRIVRLRREISDQDIERNSLFRVVIAVSIIVLVLMVAYPSWQDLKFSRQFVSAVLIHHNVPAVNYYYFGQPELRGACPAGSDVQVWGWASELYAYYDWMPATRYVNTDYQLIGSSHTRYYRVTLLHELEAAPPRCIVEAIGPHFVDGFAPTATLPNIIPKSRAFLHQCYAESKFEVGSAAGSPEYFQKVPVYVRDSSCNLKSPAIRGKVDRSGIASGLSSTNRV